MYGYEMSTLSIWFQLSTEELQEQYKVKQVVCADPGQKLSVIKIKVGQLASSYTEQSLFAYLYACAVMEG